MIWVLKDGDTETGFHHDLSYLLEFAENNKAVNDWNISFEFENVFEYYKRGILHEKFFKKR